MKVFKMKKGCLFLFLLTISFFVFSHLCGCNEKEHDKIHTTSLTLQREPQFTKEGDLTFFNEKKEEIITIDIEIADTHEEMTRGLMYRRTMAETQGMFFVYDMYKYQSFWMKNTYIPLDMIFIDKKMQIVKIKKNTTPLSEDIISIPRETYYAIEVNAGFCDQHGIKIRDTIKALKIH